MLEGVRRCQLLVRHATVGVVDPLVIVVLPCSLHGLTTLGAVLVGDVPILALVLIGTLGTVDNATVLWVGSGAIGGGSVGVGGRGMLGGGGMAGCMGGGEGRDR